MIFLDRCEAGRRLAGALAGHIPADGAVVLGLAPGGMPVAAEVAHLLGLPLDVFVVRKLMVPGLPAMVAGAVTSGGARVVDAEIAPAAGLEGAALEDLVAHETRALEDRERSYRGARPPLEVAGRTVVLVDDALATGTTLRFAIEALRSRGASRVIAAVPVAPGETCEDVGPVADELICLAIAEPFHDGAAAYGAFDPVCDAEVTRLLAP